MLTPSLNASLKTKMTPIGEIPVDWQVRELGDLASISSGGTPDRGRPEFWGGSVPWITTSKINYSVIEQADEFLTELGLQRSAAKVFPRGTLLMAMYGQGETRGRVGVLGINAAVNQACCSIQPTPELDVRYLFQFLCHNYKRIRELAHGGNQANLSGHLIRKIRIGVPPLPEQLWISTVLTKWDRAIERMEKLIAAKKQLKHGLMQQLLSGKKRFGDFTEHGWKRIKIGDFTRPALRVVMKPTKPFKALGIRSHGKGTFIKRDFDPAAIEMTELYVVRESDLIVNITFAWEGAIAIAGAADDGALVSHRFPTYEFLTDYVIPDYFRHVILQRAFVLRLGLISPGGAGRNRVLSKHDFARLELAIPSLPEQRRIAAVLDGCDREIQLLRAELSALQNQKKGLMQNLLTGKVRVTHLLTEST